MPIPTITEVIGSATTTANTSAFMTYLLPLLYMSFAVVAVVAIIRFVIGVFHWLGHKVSHSVSPEESESKNSWEWARNQFNQRH